MDRSDITNCWYISFRISRVWFENIDLFCLVYTTCGGLVILLLEYAVKVLV